MGNFRVIINNQQLIVLFQTLTDSLKVNYNPNIFSYNYEYRSKVFDDIINQQSTNLREIE